ncbi:MAG: hypothetical protein CMD22_04980 [Flavobacteriales bacterium]|nr:hypothetical protein [Flavobacteriales bacterium]|tara:strand:+ start:29316 stop:31838 length:2523 start_codon:yes stop_codon:yes gene_type:complete
MKKSFILNLFILVSLVSYSQTWEENALNENKNATFFDLKKSFDDYRSLIPYTKGNGYKPYARTIDFLEPRVDEDGFFPGNALWDEWLTIKNNQTSKSSSNWNPLGPFDVPIILSNNKKRGNGRINCIEFDPFNENVFWVGSPGGGLWKTSDGGLSWNTNTDNLPVLGVSDILIHPTNTDIMYIATGDAHGGDTYSIGVLKSTNGGVTWDTTGLSYNVSQSNEISKLEMNPNYPDSIFAVTGDNILLTVDGGGSWTIVGPNGRWRDIHYKPGNTNVLYAMKQTSGSSNVYRSIDAGATWQVCNNGVSNSNKRRPLIAVTPANPEVVYALFSDNGWGFHGIYKSIDGGDNWSLQSNTPNILGRDTDGTSTGGQSWYDMSLAVSNEDENHLYVGGINLWESTDGGITWEVSGSSGNSSDYSYMHVDQHATEFNPLNNIAYAGNDGGLYKYFNILNTWLDISDGLEISQFYKIGLSKIDDYTLVVGAQDNGTERLSGATWDAIRGSDGMECIIDHYNDDIIYSSSQYGGLKVTYNGGVDWDNIKPVNYEGAWVTPYKMHPLDNNVLVVGYNVVYKTNTAAAAWDSISPTYGQLKTIALAPSDLNYIYAATYSGLWVTKDDGNSWDYIKTGLPAGNISDVTVSNINPDRVFVTLSSFNANDKVFESNDAGDTWTNISGTQLPNLPVNCIVFQSYAKDDLYIGTDIGVYHRDSTMTEWQLFNTGLPHVSVRELEIQYSAGKIRAATFGRGVWESDLNSFPASINSVNPDLIKIFPNPVNNLLTVSAPYTLTNSFIKIYSVTGQLVIEENLVSENTNILCKDLTEGVYIYKVLNGDIVIKTDKLFVH